MDPKRRRMELLTVRNERRNPLGDGTQTSEKGASQLVLVFGSGAQRTWFFQECTHPLQIKTPLRIGSI